MFKKILNWLECALLGSCRSCEANDDVRTYELIVGGTIRLCPKCFERECLY